MSWNFVTINYEEECPKYIRKVSHTFNNTYEEITLTPS